MDSPIRSIHSPHWSHISARGLLLLATLGENLATIHNRNRSSRHLRCDISKIASLCFFLIDPRNEVKKKYPAVLLACASLEHRCVYIGTLNLQKSPIDRKKGETTVDAYAVELLNGDGVKPPLEPVWRASRTIVEHPGSTYSGSVRPT